MATVIKECKKHGECIHYIYKTRIKCSKCNIEAVTRFRQRTKQKAVEYKGGKCETCGYSKYIGALEFHHLDPSQKDFSIGESGITRSFADIKNELDKCIMLCSNCHKETHAGLLILEY